MNISFATAAKASDAANEDHVVAAPDVVVLLDGAGVPPDVEIGCSHGLPWFVRTLAGYLVEESRDYTRSLACALKRAIATTAAAHQDTCEPGHPLSPSATVVAIRARENVLDWLVLGDSTLVLRTVDGIRAVSDQRLKQGAKKQRAALRRAAGPVSDLWTQLVAEERQLRNRADGYWIAAGDPVAADHALTGSMPTVDLRGALLMSDGAARPVDPFGAATWEECFAHLVGRGPASWLKYVRDLENADPDRARWPRSKKHDDATIAYVT